MVVPIIVYVSYRDIPCLVKLHCQEVYYKSNGAVIWNFLAIYLTIHNDRSTLLIVSPKKIKVLQLSHIPSRDDVSFLAGSSIGRLRKPPLSSPRLS